MSSPHRLPAYRLSVPLVVIILAACAPITRPASSPFENHDPKPISVVVENNGFYDATVYVESQGGRFRLGTVGGGTTERFVPPSECIATAGAYHLVAVYSGRRHSVKTRPIEVDPGSTTVWSLEQSEWFSTVVIRQE